MLADDTDVTVQMVARAADDWELEAEWAFLRYSLTDDLSFRAGRLRLPLYLFSESLEVGFSYPWVRPPSEMYALPVTNYEGIDLNYSTTLGDWAQQLQVFAGSDAGDNYKTSNFYGANFTLSSGPWTYRGSVYDFDIEFSSFGSQELPNAIDDGGTYYTMSGMYDNGDWLVISEISLFDTRQTQVFRDTDAAYITVGKYLGKWTPHFTYAKSYTTDEPVFSPIPTFNNVSTCLPDTGFPVIPGTAPCSGTFVEGIEFGGLITKDPLNFTNTSYTLGLRYNLSPNTSAKMEWSHYTDLHSSGGIWSQLRFNGQSATVDDIDIYSLILDVVF